MTVLGDYLKAARGGRPQGEVAARIDMEQAEWSKWETGKRARPSPEQLRAFAYALGVPVENVALAYAGVWPDADDEEPRFWDVVRIPPETDADQKRLLIEVLGAVGPTILESSRRWAEGELSDAVPGTPPRPLRGTGRRAASR